MKVNKAMSDNLQKSQSVFWIEVEKINPNPMQPRYEFDEGRLKDLSESIRQYGVLQPLVVTRKEIEDSSGITVTYELIAGERRLRASKLAGLFQVPAIIHQASDDKLKLELAIIENLQREDLNPIERARAFKKLIETFSLKHFEVAERVGKSRVYVTNSLRLLNLPEEIQGGVCRGIITEGHMRPILMLAEYQEEQFNLYNEILEKKLNVRQAENISRRIAFDRARKKEGATLDSDTRVIEEKLAEVLGTRVRIEKTGKRGKIHIDFFSEEDLRSFLDKVSIENSFESVPLALEGTQKEDGEVFSDALLEHSNEKEIETIEIQEATSPMESIPRDEEDEIAKNFTI